jgi:ferritin-like protein
MPSSTERKESAAMAGSSAELHEYPGRLSEATIDRHRAIVSLMEELEAVDWYDQRVEATDDETLAALLAHNRDEEKEHAAMNLEWLRRHDPGWDEQLRTYLFTDAPILDVEDAGEEDDGGGAAAAGEGDLGIGSLTGAETL